MATALALTDVSPVVQEIRARMDALNVGQAFIAEWNNFSQGEMSKILAGVRTPDASRVAQIESTLNDLEALARIFRPAKLAWDLQSVRVLVEHLVKNSVARKNLEESLESSRRYFVLQGGVAALDGRIQQIASGVLDELGKESNE